MIARNRDPRVYVEDIRQAIEQIEEYTIKGRDDFMSDEMTQDAVIYKLAIIGEAASKLPPALKKKYSAIPWKDVIGLRSVIIHDYANIKLPRIWLIVSTDLPPLKAVILKILEEI